MTKGIKLYNFTKLSDAPFKVLAQWACRRTECKPNIVVIVKPSDYKIGGKALSCDLVNMNYFIPGASKSEFNSQYTNRGFYWVSMPNGSRAFTMKRFFNADKDGRRTMAYNTLWSFFEVVIHETKHVADMQARRKFGEYNRRHDNRIHERRANITDTLAIKELREKGLPANIKKAFDKLADEMVDHYEKLAVKSKFYNYLVREGHIKPDKPIKKQPIELATDKEAEQYRAERGCSIYGWIEVDGHRCAVEYGDLYDVLAPEGMMFVCDGTTIKCCTDLKDVIDRCNGESLEPETREE